MNLNDTSAPSPRIQRLMAADLAMWADDQIGAELALKKLVRPGFIRMARIEPQNIDDWVTRTAEARYRQLFYRRGRERAEMKSENGVTTIENERSRHVIFQDTDKLIRIRCSAISPERLLVRGYVTDLSDEIRSRLMANARRLHFSQQTNQGLAAAPKRRREQSNVVTFAISSVTGQVLGKFRFSSMGLLGGQIFALPSVTVQNDDVIALLGRAANELTTKK